MLILLVRHEEEKLRELRSFAETCYPGSEIAAFTDGAGALAYIRACQAPIDLCITEVEMPGAAGFDLTRALREKDRWTKVTFIADSGDYALAARNAWVDDYLVEPVTLLSVWHTISNCEPFLSGYMGARRDLFRLEDYFAQRGYL